MLALTRFGRLSITFTTVALIACAVGTWDWHSISAVFALTFAAEVGAVGLAMVVDGRPRRLGAR